MDKEKTYTVSSAESELKKLRKAREKKLAQIKAMTLALKEDNLRIKELESIYDHLCKERLQNAMKTVIFKEKDLSAGQVMKYMQMIQSLGKDVDRLDMNRTIQMIRNSLDQDGKEPSMGEHSPSGNGSSLPVKEDKHG